MFEIKWKKVTCPKGEICQVVEMSPTTFLSKVPSPCREGYTALEDLNRPNCWSQSSINYIMNQVKKGVELDPPMLDYTRMFRGFPTHEGRHTAFVAYKLGYENIPVLVIGKTMSESTLESEVERIVVEEYSRIIDKATEIYGAFTPPKVYIPKLYEEQWKRELMPPTDTAKFYGTVYFPPEGPFFVINTWALTREMEVFGKDHAKAKVRETLCHELIHYLKPDLSEVEINIEGEKLIRLIHS